MFESILLESGKFFIGRRSSIGAKVVDDTEDITIPVSLLPPEEGKSTIISISKPDTFTPGVTFRMTTTVRNDGGDDSLFIQLVNTDTGAIIKKYTSPGIILSGGDFAYTMVILRTDKTDFHGRIEVGHIT